MCGAAVAQAKGELGAPGGSAAAPRSRRRGWIANAAGDEARALLGSRSATRSPAGRGREDPAGDAPRPGGSA